MLSNYWDRVLEHAGRQERLAGAFFLMMMCSCLMMPLAWASTGAASLAPQAKAGPIVTALKDSHRRPRSERAHWYNFRGPKEFTYLTADGDTVNLPYLVKGLKDERPYKQRAPIKHKANQVRGVVMWCAPFISLGWGAYTATKANP